MTSRTTLKRLLLAVFLTVALLVTPSAGAYAQQAGQAAEGTAAVNVPSGEKDFWELLLQVKDLVQKVHPSGVDSKALREGLLRGLMQSIGDPHSEYLTEDEYTQFSTSVTGTYSGVGVVIQVVDGQITVVNTVKGSPAEEAGIEAGDVIISVDGKEYSSLDEAAMSLRGPAGTSVVVEVARPSTGETLVFVLSRENITPSAVEAEPVGDGLYYIDINQFDVGVGLSFASEIARVKALGAKGIVLDLRDNPGGLLDVGVKVAEQLVPKGPIVELRGSESRQVISGQVDTQPIPVVVLVNGWSASASEIVAGAVRDYGVGILVGERTYGKGSIQQLIALGDGLGAIKLTVADYFTPSGTSISGTGLAPDIEVNGDVSLPGKLVFKRPLKTRIVGLDVLALQESLSFLGYYRGELDGVFGPGTEAAVRSFLADQKSSYTGAVGAAEIEAINAAVLAKAANAPDVVYSRGLEALRHRVQTGTWPAAR